MASQLRWDDQVVVITGAGNGLGRQYALYFASRGARVVVNDLGGTWNARGPKSSASNSRVADIVVEEIRSLGGTAVANYSPVQEGEAIIETALQAYGRVDVLINNAGILRDVTVKNMKVEDFDAILDVHVHGAMRTTRAAWRTMRKQKFGRIINTSSASGLFGAFGQSNYAAAKMALVGFTHTLAKEGRKYNILVNALAPSAGSRMTASVWPPEMMEAMKPDWVVPLVAALVHSDSNETGGIFEAAAGHYSKIRYERSKGAVLRPDETMTPEAVLEKHAKIVDFTNPDHPTDSSIDLRLLEEAWKLPKNSPTGPSIDFKGRVVLVTGAGNGLGRAYALQFAKLGAKVAVNDVVDAAKVVREINSAGGEAIAIAISVKQGDAVVAKVIEKYGRIDVVINNAGILGDRAFHNMTDELWHHVYDVHLRGTFLVTKAAWPYFLKQKYGRVVNITSTSGIYGNFGQANYSSAKLGIVGFGKSCSREGEKYNIIVNTVAPSAGTNMTRTVIPEEQVQAMRPDYVAPLVVALCSEKPPATGRIYEAGCGWFASTRWQRARGADFEYDKGIPSVEQVAQALEKITRFDNEADNPDSPADSGKWYMANALRSPKVAAAVGNTKKNSANRKYLNKIHAAMEMKSEPVNYKYTNRDVILYNLGIGAKRTDLPLVFEGDKNFQALPTFGIVPGYYTKRPYEFKDIVPNFDMRKLLHGEQYLEIKQYPIPTSATLTATSKLIEVIDKGNAAIVRTGTSICDAITSQDLFYLESVSFIREAGNFDGAKKPSDRGAATAANNPPNRKADVVVSEKTSEDLAALYRLMGDRNPLHIDPEFSKVGGFETPILHGLATFGIVGKHVFQTFGAFRSMKVRFSGTVLPGQTIVTEMWREGEGRVVFRAKVAETGKGCVSNAAVELVGKESRL